MKSFLIIAIVLLLILVSSIFADDYNYDGGPASWNVNHPKCGGNKQSPINFNTITDNPSALPLNFLKISGTDHFNIANKGHTIEITDLLSRSSITINSVTYNFQQVHFHTPSEHRINGKHYDAEAHFVFKDRSDNLSVIGFLYSVNAGGFSKFLNSINNIYPPKGETWEFGAWHNITVDLSSEFYTTARTRSSWAYRYSGSLTTPPCSETVTWWVATKILPISVDQLITLRDLIGYNSRPTQPRNGRLVPG